jgi:hypothetical protein
MKYIFFSSLLSAIFAVSANWDSVAVFHRPEKVIVLMNEEGAQESSRLQNFMELFNKAVRVHYESGPDGIKIACDRAGDKATCIFRFTPGERAEIEDRSVRAYLPLKDLESFGFNLKNASSFEMKFLNSNGDQFHLWVEGDLLMFVGGKKTPIN